MEKRMLFYHFITKIQMIIMMISFVWSGLVYFRGTVYGLVGNTDTQALYNQHPFLSVLDKAHGIALIAMAISAYVIRKQLIEKKKTGPKNYLTLLLLAAAETGIYSLASGVITKTTEMSSMSYLLFVLLYFFLCLYYFKSISSFFY